MNIKLYEDRYQRVLLISITYFMKTFLLPLVFYFESSHIPKASILRFISYKTFYYSIANGKKILFIHKYERKYERKYYFRQIIAYIVWSIGS
jgi:hypothetical protein